MKRDIRMAGYKNVETSFGDISSPVSIESARDDCCDKITLIYDKDKLTRVKLLYEVLDNRLVKTEFHCEVGGTCSDISGNWKSVSSREPVAQNVSNLKFLKDVNVGDSLYFWSTDHGYDIHKIPVNTGLIESKWKLECCESGVEEGKGRSMTTDGVNTFYFWIDKKIYEVDILTGK